MRQLLLALTFSAIAFPALAPAFAQTTVGQPNQAAKAPGCSDASTAQAATGPAPASRDGTAPGNTGSTGWSGGTGGSFIGTNPSGALASSQTWQPATARGLDPISSPVRPASAC